MSHEDEELLKLGRMVTRMIGEVKAAGEFAYGRRHITFRGGSIELLLATKPVADAMEEAAAMRFNVEDVSVPPEGH